MGWTLYLLNNESRIRWRGMIYMSDKRVVYVPIEYDDVSYEMLEAWARHKHTTIETVASEWIQQLRYPNGVPL